MSEEELNKKWLKEQLKEFAYAESFFDKILELCSEQYRNGLEQGKFDAMMDKLELINWLESKNNITLQQHKTIEPVIKIQEVIDKIKEMN